MDISAVIGASMGLFGGAGVGFVLGRRFRAARRKRAFWAASAGTVLAGMVVILLAERVGLSFVAGVGLGLVTGALNGLRWGMGRLADKSPRPGARSEAQDDAGERRPEDRTAHPAT